MTRLCCVIFIYNCHYQNYFKNTSSYRCNVFFKQNLKLLRDKYFQLEYFSNIFKVNLNARFCGTVHETFSIIDQPSPSTEDGNFVFPSIDRFLFLCVNITFLCVLTLQRFWFSASACDYTFHPVGVVVGLNTQFFLGRRLDGYNEPGRISNNSVHVRVAQRTDAIAWRIIPATFAVVLRTLLRFLNFTTVTTTDRNSKCLKALSGMRIVITRIIDDSLTKSYSDETKRSLRAQRTFKSFCKLQFFCDTSNSTRDFPLCIEYVYKYICYAPTLNHEMIQKKKQLHETTERR